MARPTRIELLAGFFPEIKEKSTTADKEASIRINALMCEAILNDLLSQYVKAFEQYGRGVLCLYLAGDEPRATYATLHDWQRDLETAQQGSDTQMEQFFSSAIDQIEAINPAKAGLIMLVDNTSAQMFPIDREQPAGSIQAMLEEFAS
jgi:hypothetical protein